MRAFCVAQLLLLSPKKKKRLRIQWDFDLKSARSLNLVFAVVTIIYHIHALRVHRCTFLTYQVHEIWIRAFAEILLIQDVNKYGKLRITTIKFLFKRDGLKVSYRNIRGVWDIVQ